MSQPDNPIVRVGRDDQIRRLSVPERSVANQVVVARPLDGSPLVLTPVASAVWRHLADVTSPSDIERRVSGEIGDVDPNRLGDIVSNAVAELDANGLLQRV